MSAAYRCAGLCILPALFLGLIAGCGSSTGTPSKPQAAASSKPATPPTAAIGNTAETPKAAAEEPESDAIEAPKEGTAEWYIREATKLKLAPPPADEDVETLRAHRRERNLKIIELSEKAVAQTHKHPDSERVFNVAVHNLLEARLQLALQGAAEDIDALYTDAQSLIDRNAKSTSAVDASFTLVNLAYNLARRPSQDDKSWIREFAKQAAFFAGTYPAEELRGVPLLFTAARSCELNGLQEEAVACYSLLTKTYPQNQYAPRATTILRRLQLPGNTVQIAGPTLGGGQFALDDMLGKPVLIVFWSSEARPFEDQLPIVQEAAKKHSTAGLTVVGINLDAETAAAQKYIADHKIAWPQVVYDDADRRGWNHPVANNYGVMEIPAYWLIDPSGVVVSTTLAADGLDAAISEAINGPVEKPAKTEAPAKTAEVPAQGK